jgi:hypothetical protein
MKIFHEGHVERAVCDKDGLVTATFRYRDVPFSDGSGLVRDLLVGVCDVCDEVILSPPQSIPAISAARKRATRSVEANLPASYVDALDAAASRVDVQANTEFRKRLLMFYLHRYARGDEAIPELVELAEPSLYLPATGPRKRLSFKLSERASEKLDFLLTETGLPTTELLKALIGKIAIDVVKPAKPVRLAELIALCDVMNA